jgi:superfamily II DNA/RNA helicase
MTTSSSPRAARPGSAANSSRPGRRRRPKNPNTSGASSARRDERVPSAPRAAELDVLASATTSPAVLEPTTFEALGVPSAIVTALAVLDVMSPFPIQQTTLPDSLAGRDLLGRGKTGSGKTIAFAIPTVARLAASGARRVPNSPRALVLVPTRELANQVAATLKPLADAMQQKVITVFGGVGQDPQVRALRSGVDIVVACPGRLEDLVQQRHCRLDKVEITVLDEADHMADLGFLPGVKRLLDATPSGAQRLLFSATLDHGIDVLVKRYLTDPVVHSVDPGAAAVTTMVHHVLAVAAADKFGVVARLAGGADRSLLFTRTKHGAKKLAKQLTAAGIPAVEMHGNLSQNARQRNLEVFSDGSVRVLVATDIAARGIHVDDIALVVHVDPPAEHKAYLHRSGRTARAGAEGVVITVMTPDQVNDVRDLARAAKIEPTITRATPEHPLLAELAGPAVPFVTPRPAPAAEPNRSRGDRPDSRRNDAGRPGNSSARPGARSGQSRTSARSGRGNRPR